MLHGGVGTAAAVCMLTPQTRSTSPSPPTDGRSQPGRLRRPCGARHGAHDRHGFLRDLDGHDGPLQSVCDLGRLRVGEDPGGVVLDCADAGTAVLSVGAVQWDHHVLCFDHGESAESCQTVAKNVRNG